VRWAGMGIPCAFNPRWDAVRDRLISTQGNFRQFFSTRRNGCSGYSHGANPLERHMQFVIIAYDG